MRDWTGFEFADPKTGMLMRIAKSEDHVWTPHRFFGGAELSNGWSAFRFAGGEWEVDKNASYDDSILQQIAERQQMTEEARYFADEMIAAVDDPRVQWPEWKKLYDAGMDLGW